MRKRIFPAELAVLFTIFNGEKRKSSHRRATKTHSIKYGFHRNTSGHERAKI